MSRNPDLTIQARRLDINSVTSSNLTILVNFAKGEVTIPQGRSFVHRRPTTSVNFVNLCIRRTTEVLINFTDGTISFWNLEEFSVEGTAFKLASLEKIEERSPIDSTCFDLANTVGVIHDVRTRTPAPATVAGMRGFNRHADCTGEDKNVVPLRRPITVH